MDLNILMQRFAEQSPLIIGCGIAIWQLQKMYKDEKCLLRKERAERSDSEKTMVERYTSEINQLHEKYGDQIRELAEKNSNQIQQAKDDCAIELKDIQKRHAAELKILNTYIRERDVETITAMEEMTQAVSIINNLIRDKFPS